MSSALCPPALTWCLTTSGSTREAPTSAGEEGKRLSGFGASAEPFYRPSLQPARAAQEAKREAKRVELEPRVEQTSLF